MLGGRGLTLKLCTASAEFSDLGFNLANRLLLFGQLFFHVGNNFGVGDYELFSFPLRFLWRHELKSFFQWHRAQLCFAFRLPFSQ